MNQFISIAKILPPRPPRVLDRPRLISRLQENREKKLVLILGQAAQGKSTLVASYLESCEIPVAWINLGPEDFDAAGLFQVLVHSLQKAAKDADLTPLLQYPAVSLGPREEALLYREWVDMLFERLPLPVQVVFDSLDRLKPDAPAMRFLRILLLGLPQNIHVMLLSRNLPPFELDALRTERQICFITNEDLAFTPDEVKTFFRKVQKMSFSSSEVKKIHRTTQGWVGGLILLSESLKRFSEEERKTAILDQLPDRFSKELFAYFREEIFASQTDELRDFLVKSSILDTLEPGFVNELLQTANADRILDDLARRNLFVQPAKDQEGRSIYKYHHLFREFLQAKLMAETEEDERQSLFRRAGNLYGQRGEMETAAENYIEAKAYSRAATVIQAMGMTLLQKGRLGDLAKWLERLPKSFVQDNPWLLYYHYLTGRFMSSQAYLSDLQRANNLFRVRNDISGELLSLAYLIEASILRGNPTMAPLHALAADAELLLQSLPSHKHGYERAVLWFQLGFAYYLRLGDLRKGYHACYSAYLLARDLRDIPLQLNSLIHAYDALSILGEFSEARKLIGQVEKLLRKCEYPDLRAQHFICLGNFHFFSGDTEKGHEDLGLLRKEVEEHGLTYLYPVILLNDSLVKQRMEAYEEAMESAKGLANVASAIGDRFMYGIAFLLLALAQYRRSDFIEATTSLEVAAEVFSTDPARSALHLGFAKILMSLVAGHGEPAGSLAEDLRTVLNGYQDTSNQLFLKEAHLAMALLKWRGGEKDAAVGHLEAGLKIMREREYGQSVLLSKADLVTACILAIDLQIESVLDFAAQLLCGSLAASAESELDRLSESRHGKVASKAREIRKAIHRATVPRLRIETLGGFRVRRGNTPMEEWEWQAQQPKLLLKAIVTHGSYNVPKGVVIEDLWPQTPAEAAERNLKVILHRLRKVLEPELNKDFGSSYVHLGTNLLSLDPELCHTDVDEFVSLVDQGRNSETKGDCKSALSLYGDAVKVYGGDFLPEELYRPWVDPRRDELRNEYIELLYRMARLSENLRRGGRKVIDLYEKIIRSDRFQEPAYQRLMIIYSNRGMRNQVLKVYEECRKTLQEELGVVPDELTTAIYRKALGTE